MSGQERMRLSRNPWRWLLTHRAAARLRQDFVWLSPLLVQGGAFADRHAPLVAAMGIESVLDLRATDAHDASALAATGLAFYHLPLSMADAPTQQELDDGVRWALDEEANTKAVLVHCEHGRSRSVCLAAAILVAQGHRLSAALSEVRKARPGAQLTQGQLLSLEAFAARRRRA